MGGDGIMVESIDVVMAGWVVKHKVRELKFELRVFDVQKSKFAHSLTPLGYQTYWSERIIDFISL
jgi:hypothetical protein